MTNPLHRWWRNSVTPAGNSLSFAPTALAGLDVHAAVQSHERLRLRLFICANGRCDPHLNAEALCFDTHCTLGQWLHGPGKAQLGQHRGFADLMEQHRMFHIAASNVVALARAGRQTQAQGIAQGQMEAFSNGVLHRLNAMQAWVDRRNQRRQTLAGQQRITPPR